MGPCLACGLQWVHKDSRLGVHARGPQLGLQSHAKAHARLQKRFIWGPKECFEMWRLEGSPPPKTNLECDKGAPTQTCGVKTESCFPAAIRRGSQAEHYLRLSDSVRVF